MTGIVLRNMTVPVRGFAAPGEVPASVTDEGLAAALLAGRPTGDAGLVHVAGVGCPTITAGADRGGPPLLCVHGLGHDAWDFGPFFVRCSDQARLTALDLPGFGLADKPAALEGGRSWGVQILVDAVLAAAGAMSAPPVVVASSLGGHVAILSALQAPRLFHKLVLVAPGGLVDVDPITQAVLRGYYAEAAICARRDEEIVGNSRRIFARAGTAADDQLAARKLAVHRSARKAEFARPFAGVVDDVFRHVVRRRLGALRVPALFMVGARDVVVPPDAVAAAARETGSRFISFPDVGHCPHLEAPEAFADAVMSFAVAP